MKKSILAILFISLLLGCTKDNPSKEAYFIGKWDIVEIVHVSGTSKSENLVIPSSELVFQGSKQKAKRGYFDYSFKLDGNTRHYEGDFMWWIETHLESGTDFEQAVLGINMMEENGSFMGMNEGMGGESCCGGALLYYQDKDHFRFYVDDMVSGKRLYFRLERR